MKIQGINPETGVVFEADAGNIDSNFIDSMLKFDLSDQAIKKQIDNLNVSADVKSLLYSFTKTTIKIGEALVKVGRKIIDYICRLITEHPNATFGLIFGAIVGFLISSIAVLGVVLGPLFAPIAIAFGLISGLSEDFKDKALARKIDEFKAQFTPLETK
jgi:hypothetical protein